MGPARNHWRADRQHALRLRGRLYRSQRPDLSRESLLISIDPELEETLKPYGYSSENPVSRVDPTGTHDFHITFGFISYTLWFGLYYAKHIAYYGFWGAIILGLLSVACGEGLPFCVAVIESFAGWIIGDAWDAEGQGRCECIKLFYVAEMDYVGIFGGPWCDGVKRRRR